MKRILILLAVFITGTAAAQNPTAILKKLEKNNAAIVDPKKSTTPGVWYDRANLYFELSGVYTSKLIQGQPSTLLGTSIDSEMITIADVEMYKLTYEDYIIYTNTDGIVQFWETTKGDEYGDLGKSVENLEKMKSLSEKDFKGKGAKLCEKIVSQYKMTGGSKYGLKQPELAASYFEGAVKAADLMGVVDTLSLYYAGIAYSEASLFEKSNAVLDKALSYGFDEKGMVYFALSENYDKLGDATKAIAMAEAGLKKYPSNVVLMSALINVYVNNDLDPTSVIDIIKKAEVLDPKNSSLFLVEGGMWLKLNNIVNSEEAYAKALAINDEDFYTYFNLGVMRIRSGDKLVEKAKEVDLNDVKTYNAFIDQSVVRHDLAIEALEKAHTINPTDEGTIELLRTLYYYKYDKFPELLPRYEYFDALFKKNK